VRRESGPSHYSALRSAAGLAFGPLVSGALLAGVGWRGVFAIPAAFGLLVAVAARTLGESRNPVARPADMAGTVTFTGGLFFLILAFVEAPARSWGSWLVIGCLAGCLVLLAGFVLVEHLQRAPMFDLELLRYPRFVGVCAAATRVHTASGGRVPAHLLLRGQRPQCRARRKHWPGCWPRATTSCRSSGTRSTQRRAENIGTAHVTPTPEDLARVQEILPHGAAGARYPEAMMPSW
jgi:hypothetical protein